MMYSSEDIAKLMRLQDLKKGKQLSGLFFLTVAAITVIIALIPLLIYGNFLIYSAFLIVGVVLFFLSLPELWQLEKIRNQIEEEFGKQSEKIVFE